MNRLFEIANELGEIDTKRYLIREDIRKCDVSIKKAETELIPEGGWPGSNESQRKAAETIAKANDASLIYLSDIRAQNEARLQELDMRRGDLLNERQAWEWTIRDLEQAAAGGMSVFALMEKWQEHAAYVAMNEPG